MLGVSLSGVNAVMDHQRPYLCPGCQTNRTRFELIYHFTQEVQKDPATGAITYAADELQPVQRGSRPSLDVRCSICQFTGHEGLFIKAAQRSAPPGLRPLS